MGKIYNQYMYSYPHKTAYSHIDSELVKNYLSKAKGKASLYVHLPFCQSKCGYCNLFSVAGAYDLIDSYMDAIDRQCCQLALKFRDKLSFDTLILGGGTPSLLSVEQMERLLEIIDRWLNVKPDNTYSIIEVSPNQTEERLLRFLKNSGFKRVSIGIQSFDEKHLMTLKRIHTAKKCEDALNKLKEMDFETINADLIYGLPNQTAQELLASIDKLIGFSPEEIFLYPLYIKPKTPLCGKIVVDEERSFYLYTQAVVRLKEAGYHQLSMRRFAKIIPRNSEEGCGYEQVVAIGCGGRSYIENLHFCTPYCILPKDCKDALLEFCKKDDFCSGLVGYLLNEDEEKRRYTVKNLLFCHGIFRSYYKKIFGKDVLEDFLFIDDLVKQGMVQIEDKTVKLTEKGLAFSDQIGTLFISHTVAEQSKKFYN